VNPVEQNCNWLKSQQSNIKIDEKRGGNCGKGRQRKQDERILYKLNYYFCWCCLLMDGWMNYVMAWQEEAVTHGVIHRNPNVWSSWKREGERGSTRQRGRRSWRCGRKHVWCEKRRERRKERNLVESSGGCGRRDWSSVWAECTESEAQPRTPPRTAVEAFSFYFFPFSFLLVCEKEWENHCVGLRMSKRGLRLYLYSANKYYGGKSRPFFLVPIFLKALLLFFVFFFFVWHLSNFFKQFIFSSLQILKNNRKKILTTSTMIEDHAISWWSITEDIKDIR